jgi:hypothetical protein
VNGPPGRPEDERDVLQFRHHDVVLPTTPVAGRRVGLPLPARDRLGWRLSALVLALFACHGRSATLEQLHVLLWAVRDERNAQEMARVWEGAPGAPRILRAFDPLLDDTLAVARAAGLVHQRPNGRQVLSEAGVTLAQRIRGDEDLMIKERQVLARLGTISESVMWQRLGQPTRTSGDRERA